MIHAFRLLTLLLAAVVLVTCFAIADGSPYGDPDTLPIVEASR